MIRYVIPDIHLGLNYRGIDRTEDIFKTLEVVRAEVKKEIKNTDVLELVWLGDIFDTPNIPYPMIVRFSEFLASFPNDEYITTRHIILKGNHDGEPDSRKGSPLQILDGNNNTKVIWEPKIDEKDLYIPYCSQETLDKFYKDNVEGKSVVFERCFTHIDIPDAIPGFEQQLSRGAPCIMPEWVKERSGFVFAGHIHKPQKLWRYQFSHTEALKRDACYGWKGYILGSLLAVDASEAEDTKLFVKIFENHPEEYICTCLASRPIDKFVFNLSIDEEKTKFTELLGNKALTESILVLEIVCPHNTAHEYDQYKIKEELKKNCYHLLFDFKVLKERSFKMKDLDNKLPDRDIAVNYVTAMGITDKDAVISLLDKEVFNV